MSDWEKRFSESECVLGTEPVPWLRDNAHLLPTSGTALDVAMGEGRNAISLAERGLDVLGVDRSPTAVSRALGLAEQRGLTIRTEVADLEKGYEILPETFDLIVVFYYLQRDLFLPLANALRPDGALVCETYTVDHTRYHSMSPAFLLRPNELLHAFSPHLRIQLYREMDSPQDRRAVASLIARRPA